RVLLQDNKLCVVVSDCASSVQILKPLLERRRRERMNQSLSRLRSLLLPAQVLPRPRTRLITGASFTQTRVYVSGSLCPFGTAFSACLHRATHFLEAGGKAPWLAPTVDAALSTLAPESERLGRCPKALLRELTQKRAQNAIAAEEGAVRPRAQSAHTGQDKRPGEGPHSGARAEDYQSYGPQSLWRPWP
uniref:BHLH domain-containing protein n=1 Tax=Neogobius melanostomus TaxID=47308 RepID=A0A8C6TWR7_9GOBI